LRLIKPLLSFVAGLSRFGVAVFAGGLALYHFFFRQFEMHQYALAESAYP
jgi:hypothetical protein